jgi:hypothetical protein
MLVKRGKLPSKSPIDCKALLIAVYSVLLTYEEQKLYQMKIYGKLQTITNCNPNKEKMALDRPYPKKTHWIHTEVGIGLEPSWGSKAWSSQKDLEKD